MHLGALSAQSARRGRVAALGQGGSSSGRGRRSSRRADDARQRRSEDRGGGRAPGAEGPHGGSVILVPGPAQRPRQRRGKAPRSGAIRQLDYLTAYLASAFSPPRAGRDRGHRETPPGTTSRSALTPAPEAAGAGGALGRGRVGVLPARSTATATTAEPTRSIGPALDVAPSRRRPPGHAPQREATGPPQGRPRSSSDEDRRPHRRAKA